MTDNRATLDWPPSLEKLVEMAMLSKRSRRRRTFMEWPQHRFALDRTLGPLRYALGYGFDRSTVDSTHGDCA